MREPEPRWGHLGGVSPYLKEDGTPGALCFSGAAAGRGPLQLDPAAVISYLAFSYLLNDRSLACGIKRAPWMHAPVAGGWAPLPLPPHGHDHRDPRAVAKQLGRLLESECRDYVSGARNVGILLSGGMDSRLAASILRDVQLEFGRAFSVTAMTWGLPGTRDVLYAERIARALDWNWHHLALSPELLHRNLHWAGREGAEVAPSHLHALLDVGGVDHFDVVIAGSYGDSVGRAEYSGVHVKKLDDQRSVPRDRFGIVRAAALDDADTAIDADLQAQKRIWPGRSPLAEREAGQQLHYMRRKFQTNMVAALQPQPLAQMFTRPDVVSLMWGLDPAIRDDRYYRIMCGNLGHGLADLPWARTGRLFQDRGAGELDKASRQYHRYAVWLREDLGAEIAGRVVSDRVLGTGLFNEHALRRLLSAWRLGRTCSVGRIDEIVSWLAGFDIFLEIYDVRIPEILPSGPGDRIRGLAGSLYAHAFTLVRNLLRD